MLQIACEKERSNYKVLKIVCNMKDSSSKMLQMACKVEGSSSQMLQIAWKIGRLGIKKTRQRKSMKINHFKPTVNFMNLLDSVCSSPSKIEQTSAMDSPPFIDDRL